MSFAVISALVLRYLFLYQRNKVRLIELFFWPVMELLIWGNLSVWLQKTGQPDFIPLLIGGVILWDVVFRAQQGVAISFLEDVWTKNLLNIFSAPVRPVEYVAATCVMGLLRIAVTVTVLSVLAWLGYHFNIFQFEWRIIPWFGLLMVFGWSLGIISTSLILRWGQAAESLAWAVPFLLQPVAAVYYPLGQLPGWAQKLGLCLPCTTVFEAMRDVVRGQPTQTWHLVHALVLNAVWLGAAALIYMAVLRKGRQNGTLTRVTSH